MHLFTLNNLHNELLYYIRHSVSVNVFPAMQYPLVLSQSLDINVKLEIITSFRPKPCLYEILFLLNVELGVMILFSH